jgi:hypothetical protein
MAKLIYNPLAGILIGIPARDLTELEWMKYPQSLREAALELGLFEHEKLTKTVEKEVKNAKRS